MQSKLTSPDFLFIFQAKKTVFVVAYFVYPQFTPITAVLRHLSSLAAIHSLASSLDPSSAIGDGVPEPCESYCKGTEDSVNTGKTGQGFPLYSCSPENERQDDRGLSPQLEVCDRFLELIAASPTDAFDANFCTRLCFLL